MPEHPGDDRDRYAVHHRVAGMSMAEIVEANVLDAGFPPDLVPQPEFGAARSRHIAPRRKHVGAPVSRLAFENISGLGVQEHLSRPCLAVA